MTSNNNNQNSNFVITKLKNFNRSLSILKEYLNLDIITDNTEESTPSKLIKSILMLLSPFPVLSFICILCFYQSVKFESNFILTTILLIYGVLRPFFIYYDLFEIINLFNYSLILNSVLVYYSNYNQFKNILLSFDNFYFFIINSFLVTLINLLLFRKGSVFIKFTFLSVFCGILLTFSYDKYSFTYLFYLVSLFLNYYINFLASKYFKRVVFFSDGCFLAVIFWSVSGYQNLIKN